MSVFIHPTAVVDEGAQIGEGSKIWHFCHVMAGARIGRDVGMGQNCFVASDVTVGDGCRVQNNVSLGEYALIGAGAVVAGDVQAHRLMLGVPARPAGWVCECGEVLDLGADAEPGTSATCARCDKAYTMSSEGGLTLRA